MKLSPLLNRVPDYPFRKVSQFSRDVERQDGVRIINARIGIPDVEAPAAIKEALARHVLADRSTFGYPCDVHPERGIPELIEAIIADYRQKYGVELEPENIAVTNWTKEALFNIVRLFGAGKILVPDPVYPVYEAATILSSHQVERVKTAADSGWLPDFKLGKARAGQGPVALYFCDPNNPTGAVASLDFYRYLAADMAAADVAGIFDKAYKDYILDDYVKPVSITQVPGLLDRGFELVSFSKHFNFVGIGLGWLVSSAENINRWFKLSSQYSQGVAWYKQKIGVEALCNPVVKAEIAAYFKELKARSDIFVSGLHALGLEVDPSKSTPYLWIKVPRGFDDEDFVLDTLIKRAHVALMPGSYFGAGGKGYMRATLFVSRSDIEEALERIRRVKSW